MTRTASVLRYTIARPKNRNYIMKTHTLRFRQADKNQFEDARTGHKSVETRAASVKYLPIAVGDMLTFVCGKERFSKKVTKRYHWPSIDAMVQEIPFKRIMPWVASVDELKKSYASYPNYDQKIQEHGIVGFELGSL